MIDENATVGLEVAKALKAHGYDEPTPYMGLEIFSGETGLPVGKMRVIYSSDNFDPEIHLRLPTLKQATDWCLEKGIPVTILF